MKTEKRRCVVLAGADIARYDRARSYLRDDDFIIACDCGLKHLASLERDADLVIGDFDSHPRPAEAKELILLPREKDDTDSVYAVKEGLRRGFEDFLLLGVFGNRLDHTLVNVSALLMLYSLGKHAIALDDYSELTIAGQDPMEIPDSFPYFSLLSVAGPARGVCIRGAKWNLTDAEITCDNPFASSNEPLPGQTAVVSVREGRLLLIRVFAG